MIFDTTPSGEMALARLEADTLGWLTTTHPDGRLSSTLIWFLWIDDELLIYSRDNRKVANIEANRNVAFNLNSDDRGGSVLTMQGTALIDRSYPASSDVTPYQEKYITHIGRLGVTPANFAADYSVAIRVTPTSFRVS